MDSVKLMHCSVHLYNIMKTSKTELLYNWQVVPAQNPAHQESVQYSFLTSLVTTKTTTITHIHTHTQTKQFYPVVLKLMERFTLSLGVCKESWGSDMILRFMPLQGNGGRFSAPMGPASLCRLCASFVQGGGGHGSCGEACR